MSHGGGRGQTTTSWPAWRGGRRHQHSLCHQVSHHQLGQPAWRGRSWPSTQSLSPGEPLSTWPACLEGEVVAINTVFVARKEGLRSNSTSTTFPTRSAARRPHVRGACPALENEDEAELTRRREISARRGPRTRRRGTVMPRRGYSFKTISLIFAVIPCFSLLLFWPYLEFGFGQTSLTFCEVCQKSFQSMPAHEGQRVKTCCAEKREKKNKY